MFFIRIAFWLALVIAFIPANPADLESDQRVVSTRETIGALQMVVSDVGGFCQRNPGTCDTGGELLAQFGAKAKNGAMYVHDFLDRSILQDAEPAESRQSTDEIRTGSVAN